jgi:signal transduction histidine kinase
MNEALEMAVEVMEEGRDKLGELRVIAPDALYLETELDHYGRRMAQLHPAAFSLLCHGDVRTLRATVLDELLALGREALRNAFVHAQAANVTVELTYGDKSLEMTVRDDGCGIDVQYQEGRAGHWGIPGMRERSARMGATLSLASADGAGSIWRLQLASRLAYSSAKGVGTAHSAEAVTT